MGEILEREKIELPIEVNTQAPQGIPASPHVPCERESVSNRIAQLPAEDWKRLLETMVDSTDIL
jgi:hypothetical protein